MSDQIIDRSSTRRIRVVALVGHLGRGGTERQLYLLLTHLDKQRFQADVIVFNPSNHLVYDDALRAAGIGVWHVPASHQTIPARMRFVYSRLRSLQADIVHSWTAHDNPYAGIAGRLARVPVRWGSLRSSPFFTGFQSLPAPYRYLALRTVSGIVVNSDETARQLVNQVGVPSRHVLMLANCVPDNPRPQKLPRLTEFNISERHRIVGLVGNLRRVKNPFLFVDALAPVIERNADVRGLIVGQSIASEPDVARLLGAQINALGLSGKIILAGFRSDVLALMHRFALLVISSDSEGMPNALLEAMSAGCPVVATRVGGIPELIEPGVNGHLVEAGDAAALTHKIEAVLADPASARTLGASSRETVRSQFECKTAAVRLGEMYLSALQERQ